MGLEPFLTDSPAEHTINLMRAITAPGRAVGEILSLSYMDLIAVPS